VPVTFRIAVNNPQQRKAATMLIDIDTLDNTFNREY
jgi:hypothetical protein